MPNKGYYTKKMTELRERFGGECIECGRKEDLEFAHIKDTGLSGRSRGMPQRYHDIAKNSSCYRLLCQDCHRDYDEYGDEVPF